MGFWVFFFCVHDAAATGGQYLALSKAWWSCYYYYCNVVCWRRCRRMCSWQRRLQCISCLRKHSRYLHVQTLQVPLCTNTPGTSTYKHCRYLYVQTLQVLPRRNTPGTFTCACVGGYTGDGFTCTGKSTTFWISHVRWINIINSLS